MKPSRRWSSFGISRLAPLVLVFGAAMPNVLQGFQGPLRRPSATSLAPEPLYLEEGSPNLGFLPPESSVGFVEFFKKLFGGGNEHDEEEAPATSEQRRGAWREEERQTEFAFCSDVGFRGLHPEEGGEEAACWSRCGRVCEGALFLAEDSLPEWRLISVATRTKPCKTLAKKSAVQILCKAVKKPTHFDISAAVKQEMTFDAEAQQHEQLQQLQQQMLTPQHALAPAAGALGDVGPEALHAAPESFAAAAYGRGRSGFPQWAVYLIIAGVALICLMSLCCCLCCRRC